MKTSSKKTIPFWLCLITSVALLVASFLVPPRGEVHPSVLQGIALLLGFATLAQIPVVVEVAEHIKLTKGDMTIEADKSND